MANLSKINNCLACGGSDLVPTLNLGNQPLANNFRSAESIEGEESYPLAINRCSDCDHLQLTHAVNPELIYTHYLYVSGTSGTYREYMVWYAKFVREQFRHWTTKVLDIGCNDGSQLDAFKDLGYETHGVDPARNLFEVSSKKHPIVCGFWNEEIASRYTNSMDIVTTQNSFAHIPDPLAYLKLCRDCIKHDGKIFIQTSQADMVLNGEFDTIYHEHISYYNAKSMQKLAERAGLHLIDVVKTPIHGTSYIFILAKEPMKKYRVENINAMEASLHDSKTYTNWSTGVDKLLVDLKEQITEFQGWGYRCIGYGAAAKGMTLLNASGITLDCVVDDNPLKQGLYCPGTTIPVVSSDYIRQLPNTDKVVFIPLAWNFYTEIKQKIQAIRTHQDDLFLRYFPTITAE
jgi:2-polyprenyl-3-methyl-5-hydroxy-6-metoxy-1,4-benzoquinol methylase